jgi:hypothetical protein
MNPMKKLSCCLLFLMALAAAPAFAQEKSPPFPAPSALTRFDLDFPGGTPGELIAAIQNATGRPLNAIVPVDRATLKMPPLKMKGVNVEDLFRALMETSTPPGGYARFGFNTIGVPTDSSIWYLFFSGPPPMPKSSGVYLLAPYLNQGLTVDDITTAIQTAWKMLGNTTPPQLSFHKETKLLIAVGEPSQLGTIDQVLDALQAPKPAVVSKPEPEKTK